ncbi:MAG TPA: plastocyanin/azurin family copper-binding protein [Vicinamibacterales bacterium]
MALTMVRILGWLVIAHGLSHAVLPMRGSLAPTLYGDWMPIALYGVAVVGFVAAGLGLLGIRPLDRFISPLLVLASAWSLVAIFRLGDAGLWLGAASDVALLLVGLWRAFLGWPSHPSRRRIWHVAAVTAGFTFLAYVGVAAFSYPANRTWGSTRAELKTAMPGDDQSRDRSCEIQRAVTINAPAEDVWQALRDRIGDSVPAAPQQELVLENQGTFFLKSATDEQTRLIFRTMRGDHGMPVWQAAANLFVSELPDFVTQRRMLLAIKASAEERWTVRAAEDPVRTIDIVGTDDMKYSVNSIVAAPGEEIRIRLRSKGVIPKVAMAHNVVVLHLATDIDALLKEGAPFRENDFIPPPMMKQVIAKTSFAGPGEVVQVKFRVPETEGDYPYLCTFAGHYQAGMKGTLKVQASASTDLSASSGEAPPASPRAVAR